MNSKFAPKRDVPRSVMVVLDKFPQPVVLAGDLNRMASKGAKVG